MIFKASFQSKPFYDCMKRSWKITERAQCGYSWRLTYLYEKYSYDQYQRANLLSLMP